MQSSVLSEKRTAVIGALLAAAGPMSMALYTPSMPLLADVFGTTVSTIQMSISLFFAGFTIAQLVCGPLSDAYGRRKVVLAFVGLYFAGSVLAYVAPTIEVMLFARVLQGIGASSGVAISRAIIRDQYSGEQGVRIMNSVGMMFAIAPALAPLVGSLLLEAFGWKAPFMAMVLYGGFLFLLLYKLLPETNQHRDTQYVRPRYLAKNYGSLFSSARFMLPSIVIAASLGGIYTFPVFLPFVYIDQLGLTPILFAVAMFTQNLFFLSGTFATRWLLKRMPSDQVVPIGLTFCLLGGFGFAYTFFVAEVAVWMVILNGGLFAFGVAQIIPSMTMKALQPFPHITGAASALVGFLQMGGGFMAGTVGAMAFASPTVAMGIVIPTLCSVGAACYWLGLKPLERREMELKQSVL